MTLPSPAARASSSCMTAQELIPGAYERSTLTHRQSGSMGGPAFGSADPPIGPSSMDAATIAEREKEGGGALSQRRHVRAKTQHRGNS
jgi:hypothetical protein